MFNIKYFIAFETLIESVNEFDETYYVNSKGWEILTLPLFGSVENTVYRFLIAKCQELEIEEDRICVTGINKLN